MVQNNGLHLYMRLGRDKQNGIDEVPKTVYILFISILAMVNGIIRHWDTVNTKSIYSIIFRSGIL